ncbi:uncharacterized protein [Ambystoma mexicanum]|uniref:uncharacterized protein isoform X2 n=1 Tax=Ambystoma mexicanum TaxID=8296 RepID=UPI0037E755A8
MHRAPVVSTMSASCGEQYHWVKPANKCCRRCPAGTYKRADCSSAADDTICDPCGQREYMDHENYMLKCRPCSFCDDSHHEVVANCTATHDTQCACSKGFTCREPPDHKSTCDCIKIQACGPGQGVLKKATPFVDTVCQSCPNGTYSDVTDTTSPCLNRTQLPPVGLGTASPGTTATGSSAVVWSLAVGLPVAIIIIILIVFLTRRNRHRRKERGGSSRISDSWSKLDQQNRPLMALEKLELATEKPWSNGGLELTLDLLTTGSQTSPSVAADRVQRWHSADALEIPPGGGGWKTSSTCSLAVEREQVNIRHQCSCSTLPCENTATTAPSNKTPQMGNLTSNGILLLGISQAQLAKLPMEEPPATGWEMDHRRPPVLMCDLVDANLPKERTRTTEASAVPEDVNHHVKGPPDTPQESCILPPKVEPGSLEKPMTLAEVGQDDMEARDLDTDGLASPPPVTLTAAERALSSPASGLDNGLSLRDLPGELRSTVGPEENLEGGSGSNQQPEEDEWRDSHEAGGK